MKQLESDFERKINWSKYLSKVTEHVQNKFFDCLIDPSFQRANRVFVLSFKNRTDRTVHTEYSILKVEIKDYVIIDGKNFFDQPMKNDLKTYDNIRKIETGQGDDYTTACLLEYFYFKEHYQLIAIDLSNQQKLDADPKAIQEINFNVNLEKKCNNIFHYWRSERKSFIFFKMTS